MPIYPYRCSNGHEFDAHQSIKDEPLKHCTQLAPPDALPCGAPLERLIGRVSFAFKGGSPTKRFYERG